MGPCQRFFIDRAALPPAVQGDPVGMGAAQEREAPAQAADEIGSIIENELRTAVSIRFVLHSSYNICSAVCSS